MLQSFENRRMEGWLAAGILSLVISTALLASVCRAGDWPMRGRDHSRNAVVPDAKGPLNWSFPDRDGRSKGIRWTVDLGNLSHGDPVVSGGLVWVGTNNFRPRDPTQQHDAAVLMCFDEKDGKFLYQYLSPRLPEGRVVDWPSSSLSASPLIENDRLWICTNRCEVICFDIAPLLSRKGEPKILWQVDMRAKFGVAPRAVMMAGNSAHCSIASYRDFIYVNTTNARTYQRVPAPNAPSLICFEKADGKVKWTDNSPGTNLQGVQHGSPLVMEVNGQPQVIMGQGDGWMRGFDAITGDVLWKFDINLKSVPRGLNTPFQKNSIVALPVSHDGRVYFATGMDYDWGDGLGRLCCIEPTKRGDISSQLINAQGGAIPNANSGMVWEYLGVSLKEDERMDRTLSAVVIHQGLVFAMASNGILHCVDAKTGRGLWTHDSLDTFTASPLIVGNKLYVGASVGFTVFEVAREKKSLAEYEIDSPLESGPVFANDVLYLMTRKKLTAIQE